MPKHLLNVRVRPQRVVLLINRNAAVKELQLGFEFFSKIWGGRFGQILAVDPQNSDPLTEYRLANSRPEFVYGIDIDDEVWNQAAMQACQPRRYSRLQPEFVARINEPHIENFYLADHALLHLQRVRENNLRHSRDLHLVSSDNDSSVNVFCSAMFGKHHVGLRKELFNRDIAIPAAAATIELIRLAAEFAKNGDLSWLDVTGHQLNPKIISSGWGQLSPTIVLVKNCIEDLCLYWNLRSATDTFQPSWIIPIPEVDVHDAKVIEALKAWLLAFRSYGSSSNYCHVMSQSVTIETCTEFARRYQDALSGTTIDRVDYEPTPNRLPIVVPIEYETVWPVDIVGRKLTFTPPKPKAFAELDPNRTWIVDLFNDVKTGRAVRELQLPPNLAVFELINGPCPPEFLHSALPRSGDGTESINLRCSSTNEVVNFWLPTGEEVLTEILREYGLEPQHDEKRSGYLPVIGRFGGIYNAANAFAGQSGQVLTTLSRNTLSFKEIKAKCRLGNGNLVGEPYINRVQSLLLRHSERMKRVAIHRFRKYSKRAEPDSLELRTLLEHWADKDIVSRQWKIGPCISCKQQYYVPKLDIQKSVTCTNCGHRISLSSSVPIGYTLKREVAHSIHEGIVPVVQTGRFLYGMTHQGFLWLPGVKYRTGTQSGDIDLLASCDGHLVFCECKNLEDTPVVADSCPASIASCPRSSPSTLQVWNQVFDQFTETARVAKACNASLAVLASRTNQYPQEFVERLKNGIGESIPFLLLSKEDLEKGFRLIDNGTMNARLSLCDIIPQKFPEKPRDRSGKLRQIKNGWGIYTS